MTDSENEDYQLVVVDLVDDAVVACSHPSFAGPSNELNRFGMRDYLHAISAVIERS